MKTLTDKKRILKNEERRTKNPKSQGKVINITKRSMRVAMIMTIIGTKMDLIR